MASNNKELLITLGADVTSYVDKIRRAKDITKELESEFELLSGSSEDFEKSIKGLGAKTDYLNQKFKTANQVYKAHTQYLRDSEEEYLKAAEAQEILSRKMQTFKNALSNVKQGSSSYDALQKKLTGLEQEYKKATARTETYNKRILTTQKNINLVQSEMQSLQREIAETNEKMAVMDRDNLFDGMKADIQETNRKFDLLRISTLDFGKTMVTLEQSQDHYNTVMQKTETLMSEQKTDIEASKNSIQTYKNQIKTLTVEYERYQALLAKSTPTDAGFSRFQSQVQKYREAIASCNKMIEFHSERVDKLSSDYKQGEASLAQLNSKLEQTRIKMQEMRDSITFERIEDEIQKLAKNSIQQLENELTQLQGKWELLEASTTDYKNTIAGLEARQSSLREQIALTRSILSQYQTSVTNTTQKINLLTNEKRALEAEMSKIVSTKGVMNASEIDQARKEMEKLKARYEEVNKEINEYYNQNKKAKESVQSLNVKTAQMATELKSAKAAMDKMKSAAAFDKVEKELKDVTNEIKELDAKLNVLNTNFKGLGGTFMSAGTKSELMKQKLSAMKAQMTILNKSIELHENKLKSLETKYKSLSRQITSVKTRLSTAQVGTASYDRLQARLIELETEFKKVDSEITTHKGKLHTLRTEYTATQGSVLGLTTKLNTMSASMVASFGAMTASIGQKIASLGQAFLPFTMYTGMIGGYAVKIAADFEKSMSSVRAITRATQGEFEKLSDTARNLAKVTIFTASESAEALQFLALAGYDTNQACAALPEILSLAQAGCMELSLASDLATDSLSSLGYVGEDAVKALPDYLDRVAATAANANTSIEQLMQAYIKVGGQVDNLEIDVNAGMGTSAAMLGVLANRGIKAEQAGNSLNSILINMVKKSGESAKALKALGVSMFDAEGNTRNIEEVMKDLAKALSGCTEEEKNQYLAMIGGKVQYKTLAKLMQGMVTDTGELTLEYKTLKEEIEEAPDIDALGDMAETMTDNLSGDFDIMKSAAQEFILTLNDAFNSSLRSLVQGITDKISALTEWFANLGDRTKNLVLKMTLLTAAMPIVLIAVGTLTKGFGYLVKGIGSVGVGIMSALPHLKTFASTSGGLATRMNAVCTSMGLSSTATSGLTKIMGLFNLKTLAVVAAVGALAVFLGKKYKEGCQKAIKSTDEITEGMSDGAATMANSFIDATTQIDGAFMNMEVSVTKYSNDLINGVTSNIATLTEDTVNLLEQQRDDSEDILKDGLGLLTYVTEEEKNTVIENVKEAYDKKIESVQTSQQRISEILAEAKDENRANNEQELAEIQDHYENIKEVALIAMAGYSAELATLQEEMNSHEKELNAERISEALKTAREKKENTVKEAEQEYQELKSMYDLLKDDLSYNDSQILLNAVNAAEQKKNAVEDLAEKEYAALVSAARRAAKESVDEIDWATGEIKSLWEIWDSEFDKTINTNGIKTWADGIATDFDKIGLYADMAGKYIEKFFNAGNADKQNQLNKDIENIKTEIETLGKSTERLNELFGDIPQDLGNILTQYDSVFREYNGMSTREFFSQSEEDLKKLLQDYDNLPIEVQNSLTELDQELVNAGVAGGLEQLVQYSCGQLDTLRSEFNDLPKSLQDTLTNLENRFASDEVAISLEEFVQVCSEGTAQAEAEFEKLPEGIREILSSLSEEDWARLFQYYNVALTDETEKAAWENRKILQAEATKTNETAKKSGEEQNKSQAEGISSTTDEVTTATENVTSANNEKLQEGKETAYNTGAESTASYAQGLDSNYNLVSESSQNIQGALTDIDNVRLGNVTKQLSEINRWLGVIKSTSGNTKKAMGDLANAGFGKVTKQLSEVNKWLKTVTKQSGLVEKEFQKIIAVRFGGTTKQLSEVKKWLENVKVAANSARVALVNMTSVRMGGLTSRLSQVYQWLRRVKNEAGSSSSALNSMSVSRPKVVTKNEVIASNAQVVSTRLDSIKASMARATDGVSVYDYQVSGGYYTPQSMQSQNSSSDDSNISAMTKMINLLVEQNSILASLLAKEQTINTSVKVDGREIARSSAKYMKSEIAAIEKRQNRLAGVM